MAANTHHTKLKGDIAVSAVIFDLTKKGYIISEPMSENAPYDLICDTGEKLLRIQVKYRASGEIPKKTCWSDKNGSHASIIDTTKIDYFALVNETYDIICYPPASMAGSTIRFYEPPEKFRNSYHWYADYLEFTTLQPKRKKESTKIKTSSIEMQPAIDRSQKEPNLIRTKIEWPSVEEMQRLVYEKPTVLLAKELKVSDVAINKFCKKHNISKPPRGYWAKLLANKKDG